MVGNGKNLRPDKTGPTSITATVIQKTDQTARMDAMVWWDMHRVIFGSSASAFYNLPHLCWWVSVFSDSDRNPHVPNDRYIVVGGKNRFSKMLPTSRAAVGVRK